MITLEANYSKKLGLPGYSSHQYSLTVRKEVGDISQIENESRQLFATLQSNVDRDIQNTGFLPGTNGHGNGHHNGGNGNGNGNGNGRNNGHRPTEERWDCSDKQRNLILKIVEEGKLDKAEVEKLAQERFGKSVKKLNKLEASGLIEELIERTGGKGEGARRYRRAGAQSSTLAELPLFKKRGRTVEELMTSVSASRLQCWQQCRLKFYFRYVVSIPKRASASLHIGKVVHAVLQAWNMARWRGEPIHNGLFKALFEQDWQERQIPSAIRWEDEEETQRNNTWTLLQTYFAETPIQANERPEAVEVLMEADLPEGLPKLVGIIDLVRSGGRIVDFKTSGQTPDAEKVEHIHEMQLSCYAVLYRDATGRKESGIELHHLVKLKTPKVVITPLGPMTETRQARLFRAMESYQEGLARRDFVPSPGIHCSCCEYFNECKAWNGKEETA